jgi:hypothetical protein
MHNHTDLKEMNGRDHSDSSVDRMIRILKKKKTGHEHVYYTNLAQNGDRQTQE